MSESTIETIRWRRLDAPGHETARLGARDGGDGWELAGLVELEHEGRACRLEYAIEAEPTWRTRSARVIGSIGEREVDLTVAVDRPGRWRLNGAACASVDGCVDIDLGFSPSTNVLPIRRLELGIGEQADVTAAWLPFPALAFEPLAQTYCREAERTYVYSSRGGRFVRTLEVSEHGLVTHYPGLWRAE